MPKDQHTKEPWEVVSDSIWSKPTEIPIAKMDNAIHMAKDSRRIVACVNACRGLSTAKLEKQSIQAILANEIERATYQCEKADAEGQRYIGATSEGALRMCEHIQDLLTEDE